MNRIILAANDWMPKQVDVPYMREYGVTLPKVVCLVVFAVIFIGVIAFAIDLARNRNWPGPE